jgi:hypothetical protein
LRSQLSRTRDGERYVADRQERRPRDEVDSLFVMRPVLHDPAPKIIRCIIRSMTDV